MILGELEQQKVLLFLHHSQEKSVFLLVCLGTMCSFNLGVLKYSLNAFHVEIPCASNLEGFKIGRENYIISSVQYAYHIGHCHCYMLLNHLHPILTQQ